MMSKIHKAPFYYYNKLSYFFLKILLYLFIYLFFRRPREKKRTFLLGNSPPSALSLSLYL